MKYRLFIAALLANATLAIAEDEPSRFYFDHGAEQYTRDNKEKALSWVTEGLTLYPDEHKLLALKKLLEQQQQQQQEQQQRESDSQAQQQTESSQSDGKAQSPANPSAGEDKQNRQAQQPIASEMTPEEAERLLDAMRDREANERAQIAVDRLRRETHSLAPVEKDW